MSPDPLTPKLREAVREYAHAAGDGVRADDWYLCSAVASALGVSTDQQTIDQRVAWSKFRGRVKRALDKLATDGTLVKVGARGRVRYVTPELQRQRQAEAEHIAAEAAAEAELWKRIAGELALYGLDSIEARGQSIRLSSADWQRVIRILDRAAGEGQST